MSDAIGESKLCFDESSINTRVANIVAIYFV
jgi:hypothetical protein